MLTQMQRHEIFLVCFSSGKRLTTSLILFLYGVQLGGTSLPVPPLPVPQAMKYVLLWLELGTAEGCARSVSLVFFLTLTSAVHTMEMWKR